MKITRLKIFLFSLLTGFVWIYGQNYYDYRKHHHPPAQKLIHALGNDVFLAPHYIRPEEYREYKTIIDFQPDEEVKDPFKVKNMEEAILQTNQSFYYIPVPKDSFPETAISKLSTVLDTCEKPVLLYCKSGKRAIKTYALSMASNPSGPDMDVLLAMLVDAGFDPADIKSQLKFRTAKRINN
ncbi:MAG: hypothetical protein KG003_04170 [Bacteroidetes bacterium]|nr:hypothetical protein [Bacteroidota bacterium]